MKKIDEITNPKSVLNQASPFEPIFVFTSSDASAVGLRAWANYLEKKGLEPDRVIEARECADEMDAWTLDKYLKAKEQK